jgi:hypothetical protein
MELVVEVGVETLDVGEEVEVVEVVEVEEVVEVVTEVVEVAMLKPAGRR